MRAKFSLRWGLVRLSLITLFSSLGVGLVGARVLRPACARCQSCPTLTPSESYSYDLLLEAIDRRDPVGLSTLLKTSALDLTQNEHTHMPALLHAVQVGGAETYQLLQLLLQAGADPNQADMQGQTALMLVAKSRRPDAGATAQLLISHGADVTLKDQAGQTALQMAQKTGNQAVLTKIQTALTAE